MNSSMLNILSLPNNHFVLSSMLVLLFTVSLCSSFIVTSKKRPIFKSIEMVATFQSSNSKQKDRQHEISGFLLQFSDIKKSEQSIEMEQTLPHVSLSRAQQDEDYFITESDSKSNQKSHVHLEESEKADFLDHADEAKDEISQIVLTNNHSHISDIMMHYHDNLLLAQLDISTLKPIIEHLTNAGLFL